MPSRGALRKPIALALFLAALAYPFAVYVSLDAGWRHGAAFLVAALAGTRAHTGKEAFWWWVAAGAAALAVGSLFRDDTLLLKLYPVLVNAVLLCAFAASLWRPPSVIERLARLAEPNLPAEGVRYTAAVTRVWCAFFVLNGAAALYTALFTDERAWALYNGLVAYMLMGALLLGERLIRPRVQAKFDMEKTS